MSLDPLDPARQVYLCMGGGGDGWRERSVSKSKSAFKSTRRRILAAMHVGFQAALTRVGSAEQVPSVPLGYAQLAAMFELIWYEAN